ncbi:MAG: hypothetical protein KJZ86_25680 [Caldilineaceae bacterium]|nr:hypothetical protein [Caldilineaceae bacterium]HRJ41662.1 hypothetical protein [Caldilineaceae bacterium]
MLAQRLPWINRIALLLVALVAGLVLADRFGLSPLTRPLTNLFYTWALLLSAFTLLLGVATALWAHLERIQRGENEWPLSLLLLAAFALTLVAGLSLPGGATGPLMEWAFDAIIAPGQATLFALTGFFIVAAAYRFLRLNRPGGLWILAGALLTLLVQTPLTQQALPDLLVGFADWLLVGPVMAAMRGALLGGALAAIFAGIRLFARSKG